MTAMPTPTTPHCQIRLAAPGDFDQIAQVFTRAWPLSAPNCPPTDAATFLARHPAAFWQQQAATPKHRLTVATQTSSVRGFCLTRPADTPDVLEVDRLFIDPDHHRQGLGRLLLADAITAGQHTGFNRFELWVIEDNEPALAFYRQCGWVRDGATKQWRAVTWQKMTLRR